MPQFKRPSIQTPTFPESPFGQTESAPFPLLSDQQTSAYLQGSPGYIEASPFPLPWAQQTSAYQQESHGYIEASPFPLPWAQQTSIYPPESPVYPGLSPFQSTWDQQISAYPSTGASSAAGPARLPVPQTGFPQGALPLDPAAPASTENHYQESSAYPYPEQRTQFRPPPFRPSWDQSPAYSQQLLDVPKEQPIYPEQQSLLYAQQQPLYQPVFQQPTPPLEAKRIQTKKKLHNKVLWIGLVMVIVLMVGLGALASQAGNNSTSSNIRTTTSNAPGSTGNTVASNATRISGTPTANSAHARGTPAATASQVTGTPTSTINTTASGSWTTVNSYTGSGIQQTKTFTIGNDWKILWSCQGPDVDGTPTNGVLGVFIHVSGKVQPIGVPVKVACPAGTTPASGSLEEHSGGTIYLIIAGTSSWSIQIQQLK